MGPSRRQLPFKDRTITQELRCNERIRISPIRLIDENAGQVGIVDTREALLRAREAGLDLVEVAPQSRPPVCRIMDYGKWKYAQKKKERKTKTKHGSELKEVRVRTPKISPHDLGIKIAHTRQFLARGDRVQFSLQFRGREMAHQDLGRQLLTQVKAQLADVCKVERDMGMEGRMLSMMLSPTVKAKPKAQPRPPADDRVAASPPVAPAPVSNPVAPMPVPNLAAPAALPEAPPQAT